MKSSVKRNYNEKANILAHSWLMCSFVFYARILLERHLSINMEAYVTHSEAKIMVIFNLAAQFDYLKNIVHRHLESYNLETSWFIHYREESHTFELTKKSKRTRNFHLLLSTLWIFFFFLPKSPKLDISQW